MPFKKLFKRKNASKQFPVKVDTLDAKVEFNIPWKATGKEFFDLVCRILGIRETWYFALKFVDSSGLSSWLKIEKKVQSQDIPKHSPVPFMFLAKYYPEDISEELVQEVTQHLFFLQVKHSILNMDVYCPPEVSVLLASYAIQAKFGDYDPATYQAGSLKMEELLPQRVISQYQMTPQMWEDRIRVWYADHHGMTQSEAEIEYLKIAQDLHMYGVDYFEISNKKNSDLWLGVTALGLNVYDGANKSEPQTAFPWSEIRDISFDDKKFLIRPTDKTAPDFVFYSRDGKMNKLILDLCIGNYELFHRRRKPDSTEVQQMKASAREEKAKRQTEKEKLAREKQLRKETERQKADLEQRVLQYQEEIQIANEALRRAEETTELLMEKSQIAEEETRLLTKKATDAEQECQRILAFSSKAQEEKVALEQKAREAEQLVSRMVEEGEKRATESEQLKQELLKARTSEKQAKEKLNTFFQSFNNSTLGLSANPSTYSLSAINSSQSVLPNDSSAFSFYRSTSMGGVNSSHVTDMTGGSVNDLHFPGMPDLTLCGNDILGETSRSLFNTPDIDLLNDTDVDQISLEIEKERMEYLERSENLQTQLKQLRSEIEILKVDGAQTYLDFIYEEQIKSGTSKYSTLRRSRSGSTKTRVAFFEDL